MGFFDRTYLQEIFPETLRGFTVYNYINLGKPPTYLNFPYWHLIEIRNSRKILLLLQSTFGNSECNSRLYNIKVIDLILNTNNKNK